MDPPPIAFTDRERARERSLFALYQVIDQGLEGTAMTSFGHLPEEDKWALAFAAGRFAYPRALAEQGRRIWEGDAARARARSRSRPPWSGSARPRSRRAIGPEKAPAVIAYP